MQTLEDTVYKDLERIAKRRGITIQELIRAVIVPEWVNVHNGGETEKPPVNKMSTWH